MKEKWDLGRRPENGSDTRPEHSGEAGPPSSEQRWDYDIVDLLTEQHRHIRALLDQLIAGEGDAEKQFCELVRMISVHESAEEQVVHPVAERAVFGVYQFVLPRLREEHEAKRALAELWDLGVHHVDFLPKLSEFAKAVSEHAAHEEVEEFPVLRRQLSVNALQRMVGSVQAAEAVAPTRPHPHAGESATATLLMGPPLALFDRTRDAVRRWAHVHL
jgi:hemerythrin superfamily protein